MMADSLIYKCRREALGLTIDQLAEKCGVTIETIIDFEAGKCTEKEDKDIVKVYLRKAFCDLDSIDHYKARILELAMEISRTKENKNDQFNCISHMLVELGKLQAELNGVRPRRANEWKKMGK